MSKHRKYLEVDTTEKCTYGCGNIARYKSPSGILTCQSHCSKCAAIKKINSAGLKKAHKEKPGPYYDYETLPQSTKDRMAHSRGKKQETYEPLRRQVANRHQNLIDGKWEYKLTGFVAHPELRWKRNKFQYYDSLQNFCVLESWNELKLANELDRNSIRWIRPSRYKLIDGKYYEPDFYLIDYGVFLDPKSKFFGKTKYQGYSPGEDQTQKIARFEKEYNVKVLILWDHEKDSMKWENIKKRV